MLGDFMGIEARPSFGTRETHRYGCISAIADIGLQKAVAGK